VIILLEAVWLCMLLFVVWILFRAAKARPDDRGILHAARVALGAWGIYAAIRILTGETLALIWQNLSILAGLLLLAAVIFGYVIVISILRERAERG